MLSAMHTDTWAQLTLSKYWLGGALIAIHELVKQNLQNFVYSFVLCNGHLIIVFRKPTSARILVCPTAKDKPARLEQLPQRLDERELEVLRQAADVVMALYRVAVLLFAARRRAGLYDVRVQGPLRARRTAVSPPQRIEFSAVRLANQPARQEYQGLLHN